MTYNISIRENLKSLSLYKRFLKEESIFTNEYPSESGVCGFNVDELEKIYDNLFISYINYPDAELYYIEMIEEKISAEKEYALSTPNMIHFLGVGVDSSGACSTKVEISKNDYKKYKDKILKNINPYWGLGNIIVSEDIINTNLFNELEMDCTHSGFYYYYKDTYQDKEILYTLNDSDSILIDDSKLAKLTTEELNIAYNEIFARHGHDFQTKNLREHFIGCLWYKPVYGKTVSLDSLNEIEKENIDIIRNEINRRNNEN